MSSTSTLLKNTLLTLLIIILLPLAFGTFVLCVGTMGVAVEMADTAEGRP